MKAMKACSTVCSRTTLTDSTCESSVGRIISVGSVGTGQVCTGKPEKFNKNEAALFFAFRLVLLHDYR